MKQTSKNPLAPRPPIVTVLGHVDHGKTSLLDFIRNTTIAAREHGGITQHIGAYQITTHKKHRITFIDTPGHEAFSKMRSRGAEVSDIAILVVAGNDGVMPQTIESITHIKNAKIPCIVAMNKIDLPEINAEKIKKQLTKHGLNLEEYGGDTPVIPVSAKTGQGIEKLLDMILLLSELNSISEDTPGKTKGVVIESTLSKQKGITATVILRSGTISVGNDYICENQVFRIRALFDAFSHSLKSIHAGDPALILGWKRLPVVGTLIFDAKEVQITPYASHLPATAKPNSITPFVPPLLPVEEKVKLILRTDTAGSLEAILASLKDNVEVITSGVGTITESDIMLAKTTHSLIIGFHQEPSDSVLRLSQSEKVLLKTYRIIYELLDEIDDVVEALKKGDLVEILGEAKVIAKFNIKNEQVLGVKVISGRIARGDQIKIMRESKELGRCRIKTLHHQKDEITKAELGTEAGLTLSKNLESLTGDSIISIG